MSTLTDEEMRKILKPLEEYYANTPKKFIFGLQNFQSIREYTEIPLAPITLIYGQNSAGKSAIHDGLIFITNFLRTREVPHRLLDRWANHSRIERPLSKGYVGNPEDVVVSIESWGWESREMFEDDIQSGTAILADLWSPEVMDGPHKFKYLFCFTNTVDDGWLLRELKLSFGKDEFIRFVSTDNNDQLNVGILHDQSNIGILSVNTGHVIYDVITKLAGKSLKEMADETTFLNGEIDVKAEWLCFKEVSLAIYHSQFEFEWPERLGEYDKNLNNSYHTAATLRGILAGMLLISSKIVVRQSRMATVPPLRQVPKKEDVYLFYSSPLHPSNNIKFWDTLAREVRDKEIWRLGNALRPHMSVDVEEVFSGDQLEYVNHILQHPLFLNTGYEVIGECRFMLSAQQISQIMSDTNDHMSYWGQFIDSEVKLKLRYKPNDLIVEIEDVGVGVSQIIPVLCAINEFIYYAKAYIHQPELHLHPKQQSHLGDIFIERINNDKDSIFRSQYEMQYDKYLLIETHSEHILLRILRRIRESHRSPIKNKLFGFTADQLCVLYVDKDENGDSQIMQLRVADNGEFIDRWPHGFFTERDEDLFDE